MDPVQRDLCRLLINLSAFQMYRLSPKEVGEEGKADLWLLWVGGWVGGGGGGGGGGGEVGWMGSLGLVDANYYIKSG